jgi:hypothetical protein
MPLIRVKIASTSEPAFDADVVARRETKERCGRGE